LGTIYSLPDILNIILASGISTEVLALNKLININQSINGLY